MSKRKLHSKQIGRIVGWGSIELLGILGLALLMPIAPAETEAIDCTHGDTNPLCTTAYASSQEIGVQVATSISISMQNKATVDVVPKANRNAVSTTESTVSVATNNSEGYKLYMQAEQLTDGAAKLTSNTVDNAATINPVQGSVTQSEWETNKAYANTWGYSTDRTNYQAVPATVAEIKQVNTTAYNDQHIIDFGVAIDTSLPAGYYSNSIIVSAVANPMTAPLDKLTYLQEMETPNCQKTAVGVTKQLIDLRDDKSYWVAKLADNNCWMTQNLALDLDENEPLTPELSDVNADWTPTTTEMTVPTVATGDPAGTRSWNLGNAVLTTPQKAVTCNTGTSGGSTNNDGNNSLRPNQNFENTSHCADFQVVDSTWAYKDAEQGVWGSYTGLVAANTANKTYDSHYLIGNYYQWNAATAGTGQATAVNGSAAGSICPKGWKLPTSAQYQALNTKYSITSSAAGVNTLSVSPLYFVRSGGVDTPYGSLRYAGYFGRYWSSTTPSATNAYNLLFGASTVYPADSNYRYLGFPIRCVAQ